MRKVLLALFAFTIAACLNASSKNLFKLSFATVEQAKTYITEEDHYIKGLSQFDIDSRLGHTGGTMKELSDLQMQECREWTSAEKDTLTRTFELLEKKIIENGFHIPVPETVVLVKTTMKEEGNAGAYTRDNKIYLGERSFRKGTTAESLMELLAHELFHVLTRKDLKFKAEMYKTIGFTLLKKEIKFSDELLSRRISNPDVSCYDSYAMIDINGQTRPCTMINIANGKYEGGSFFRYLRVGLIPLDKKHRPIQEDGITVVYDLNEGKNFYDLVGRNTGYVINPEECLADNFAIAIVGIPENSPMSQLPTPGLIDNIQNVLKAYKVK